MPGAHMSEQPSDQPPEGVTVTDRPDGTQIIHATATLQAAVTTEPQEEA